MKGNYYRFGNSISSGSTGSSLTGNIQNGIDYNTAGSSRVQQVDTVQTLSEAHSLPISGYPNTVIRNYRNGFLYTERYYGEDKKAYLDIDYSNHGNPSIHQIVPHEHIIYFDAKGEMHRGRDLGIKK